MVRRTGILSFGAIILSFLWADPFSSLETMVGGIGSSLDPREEPDSQSTTCPLPWRLVQGCGHEEAHVDDRAYAGALEGEVLSFDISSTVLAELVHGSSLTTGFLPLNFLY